MTFPHAHLGPSREQDPIGSLHDVEAEAGDEEALADLLLVDRVEATELGLELDDETAEEVDR